MDRLVFLVSIVVVVLEALVAAIRLRRVLEYPLNGKRILIDDVR